MALAIERLSVGAQVASHVWSDPTVVEVAAVVAVALVLPDLHQPIARLSQARVLQSVEVRR